MGEFHHAGGLESLHLVVGEAHANALPGKLRDVVRQRSQLHEDVGLVGVDDQLPARTPRRLVTRDQTVEVLAGGHDHDGLAGRAPRQGDQRLLDLLLAGQAVAVAAGAQCRALAQ